MLRNARYASGGVNLTLSVLGLVFSRVTVEWRVETCFVCFPFFILIMFTLCSRLLFQELLKDVVLYIFFMRTINFIDSNFIASTCA